MSDVQSDDRGNAWEVAHLGLVVLGAWECAVDPASAEGMPLARADGVHMSNEHRFSSLRAEVDGASAMVRMHCKTTPCAADEDGVCATMDMTSRQ